MVEKLFQTVSVMVVDDEEFARRYVSRILEQIGVSRIMTAENGAQALEQLGELESDLDLMICDIKMPEMDGYELVRRIRYGTVPRFKDLPIIMLTGYDTEKNVQHGRVLRIDGFVVKPPDVKVFERKIRRVLVERIRGALPTEGETGQR